MTATQDWAKIIAEAVFDRIEDDKRCIKQSIEQVIYDGLLLGKAKEAEETCSGSRGGDENVIKAANDIIDLLKNDPKLSMTIPSVVCLRLDTLAHALRCAGLRTR